MKLFTTLVLCVATGASAQVRMSYNYKSDTLKGNIKKMTEYRYSYSEGALDLKTVYSYDSIERFQIAAFYSEYDSLFGKWLVQFDSKGRIVENCLYCEHESPCEVQSHLYNLQGTETEGYAISYANVDCNNLSDWLEDEHTDWETTEHVFDAIYKYKYDKIGRLEMEKVVTVDIAHVSDTNVNITSYKYDNSNRVVEIKKESINIKLGSADTVVKITKYKYDIKGNNIEESVNNKGYDKGEPDSIRNVFRYDTHNNRIEEKSYFPVVLDKNYKPHSGTRVGAGTEYIYDSSNYMTMSRSYDLYREKDGSETKDVYRTQKEDNRPEEQKEYDKQGNIIKRTINGFVRFKREIEYY